MGNKSKTSKLHKYIVLCSFLLPKWKFCQYSSKSPEKRKLNFCHSALFHTKTRVRLKYFVNDWISNATKNHKYLLKFYEIEIKLSCKNAILTKFQVNLLSSPSNSSQVIKLSWQRQSQKWSHQEAFLVYDYSKLKPVDFNYQKQRT